MSTRNHAISSAATSLLHSPTEFVSEPHEYFPAQIRDIVDAANRISTDAIDFTSDPNQACHELPNNHSYPVIDISSWMNPSASNTEDRQHAVKQVLAEAISSGSFNFIGHGIEDTLFNRLHSSADSFFSMRWWNSPVEVVLKQIFTAALSSAKGIELPTTYLKDVEEDTTGQLRVSRYTNTPGFEDAIKLLPHSDWGTLTIINSADEGLEEVRDGRWYKVPAKK